MSLNFNQKLISQFNDLNLTIPNYPKTKKHLYADYAELVVLVTNNPTSSVNLVSLLINQGFNIPNVTTSSDGEIGTYDSELNDAQEAWGNEIFDIIDQRYTLYNEKYPFTLENGLLSIKDSLSDKQEVYLFLLIASSLKYFPVLSSILTSDFEKVSKKVLKSFLPNKAIVKSLGTDSDLVGNAQTKIRFLANEMNINTREHEIHQISPQNSKEEGLDIVGWIPFLDNNPNLVCFLAQCACGREWDTKQYIETGRYTNFFDFEKLDPIHTLFIPHALSNHSGQFHQSKDIIKPILVFERFRIMEYLDSMDSLQSSDVVKKCISYQEDIV
jgi:hypothetical protein